jgi:hypothetical protein
MKKEYCDNQFCENEAIKTALVSVKKASDSERKFCAACYEVYTIGVQHGRLSENPKAYSKGSSSQSK